jgi:ubiquinone/menaquinone biosynthesis C-methylase UbiE
MPNGKKLQEIVKEAKVKKKKNLEVLDKVATDLGFVGDKYYTPGEKMKEAQPWDFSDNRVYESRSKRKPPTAPTDEELAIYKKYAVLASRYSKNNGLVLGATPELRDIMIDENLICYAVDMSKQVSDLYSSLMNNKNHKNSKMIIDNWLDMKFDDNFFSIAMADASFCNLPTVEINEKLVKKLSDIVCPKGYVVTRNISLATIKRVPVKELVMRYRDKKIGFADFLMALRTVAYLGRIYNQETYQYDAKKNFEIIEEEYKQGILNKEEFDAIIGYKNNIINTFYPEKEFIRMFEKKGFKLVERFEGKSFIFQKYCPMLVFQKI